MSGEGASGVIGTAMRMPALAVVGSDHRVIRSTETFRRRCDNVATLCNDAPEVDLVLTGKTDTAVVELGDFSISIEAVTDAMGKRQVMLSLRGEELAADPDSSLGAIREASADSAALVWAKDLEGRYLYVNPRFEQYLETSDERLRGNTDGDLPAVETVDGPRLRYIEQDGLKEPLQLEYTVPAYESRPAMAAFRFPLRNQAGEPVATCGVAAPTEESDVAQDEAVRLMQLERWNRLDPLDVQAELLEQWQVQATPGPPPAAADEKDADDRSAAAPAAEVALPRPDTRGDRTQQEAGFPREDEWVRQLRQAAMINANDAISETADALHSDLQLARKWAERASQLQGDLHEAHARLRDAEAQAQQASAEAGLAAEEANRYKAELERARSEFEAELERGAGQLGAELERTIDQLKDGLEQARAELEQARAESAQLRAELEQAMLESSGSRAKFEQLGEELDRQKAETESARSELLSARRELDVTRRALGAARAQSQSLRGPSDAALRLSEELGRALTAERERGDELARVLARIRSRLGDFEDAFERSKTKADR